MFKRIRTFIHLSIVVFLGAGSIAVTQAGVILNEPDTSGIVSVTNYEFDDVNLILGLDELLCATESGQSGSVLITGSSDSDPYLHISKNIYNDSTFVWTDYHIEVSGSAGVSYVAESATSDTFNTIVEAGGVIDFYAPLPVGIGDTVNISLDIVLPSGAFSFSVDQTPTPEPTTLLLLSFGGLALLRKKNAKVPSL